MNRLHPFVVAILLYGCAGIAPGNDPVVVDAEKSTSVFVETLNTFFQLEYQNRDLIKAKLPQVHQYAEVMRLNAPTWIATARDLTKTYKTNRTPDNKANLQTAIATLTKALTDLQYYLSQIKKIT